MKYEYMICTFYVLSWKLVHILMLLCDMHCIEILGDADRMVVDCIGSGSMTLGE